MRKFGLIGFPLGHSFSQKYFTDKFEKEGLVDCSYELFPIESIDELAQVLQENPELEGLNITIPYKQQILRWLNSIAGIPAGLAACNCIKIKDGKLFGYNTDVYGFSKSLSALIQPYHKRALVLGNGGGKTAIVYELEKLGIKYEIVSRELHSGSSLIYDELNERVVKEHQIIINTTPVGMFPWVSEVLPFPFEFIGPNHLCYDLIYNPEKTIFLQKAEINGATIKNGLEMLQIQAEESWKIWNAK